MNNPNKILQIQSVSKEYNASSETNAVHVLRDINLELTAGEIVAVIGPSGSGKSTLLNLAGSLDTPTSGQILFEGQDISHYDETQLAEFRNQKIGFVFQEHHLLPQCTVLENILVPTLVKNSSTNSAIVERAQSLLERVGLKERIHHRPGQLSGGERQRVAYVRALINEPSLLLADEPTGALDHETAKKIMQILIDLNQEYNVASILVTHALDLVKNLEHVYELKNGTLQKR
jgi:ABC-type lipoprotein export system ATPase subunit